MEQVLNKKIIDMLVRIENTMVTRRQFEQVIESIAMMSNEDTMFQIENSEIDFNKGNFKEINSVDDL